MTEHGYYDGWTEHDVIVTPSLRSPGFSLRITGRNRRDIKEYIADAFHDALASYPARELEELEELRERSEG